MVLETLLSLQVLDLTTAMTEAAEQLGDVLGADKVDVFFCDDNDDDEAEAALVAEGTSDTPMGRCQRALGLDRLPLTNGGRVVWVYQTDQSYRTQHADQDPLELPGVVNELGVRSMLATPLKVAGTTRGVLVASSSNPDAFTHEDLAFLQAVARWIGLTSTRLAHAQWLAAQAAEQGLREGADQVALTARQLEVAALIRAGLTNAQIAQQLVLDPGTVANHVASILSRLGFRSRAQVAAWATERRLQPGPPDEP